MATILFFCILVLAVLAGLVFMLWRFCKFLKKQKQMNAFLACFSDGEYAISDIALADMGRPWVAIPVFKFFIQGVEIIRGVPYEVGDKPSVQIKAGEIKKITIPEKLTKEVEAIWPRTIY